MQEQDRHNKYAEAGEKNVQQIAQNVELDLSVVSRHLTFLKNAL